MEKTFGVWCEFLGCTPEQGCLSDDLFKHVQQHAAKMKSEWLQDSSGKPMRFASEEEAEVERLECEHYSWSRDCFHFEIRQL